MTTATLTSKHQVTLPKEVRERLVLRKGDQLQFVASPDGSYRLEKWKPSPKSDGAARRRLPAGAAPLGTAEIRRLVEAGAKASVARRRGR